MKALVFDKNERVAGREVLGVIANCFPGRLHDIRIVHHPHRSEVYIKAEGEPTGEVLAQLTSFDRAEEVRCDWESFISGNQRTGIIPANWPQPIQ